MPNLRPLTAFPATSDQLLDQTRQELSRAQAELDRVLGVFGARTLQNTLEPYHALLIELANAGNRAGLLSEVHPAREVREAAEKATQEVSAFATELSLNRPLYDALAAAALPKGDPVTAYWHSRTLLDFRRAGVDRDEATRERLKQLSEEMVKLGQDFDRNIREDVRELRLRPEQLKGLPPDYLAAHPPGPDGKVRITTDYPDYLPFRQYAEDDEARRELYLANLNRAYPANEPIYLKLLACRREQAVLLGYRDWADYVTEDKMIGTGEAIRAFIRKVATAAQSRARADYQRLLQRRRQDDPGAREVTGWQAVYYEEKVKKEQLAFDSQSVRPYFEFRRTCQGVLDATARLFGIRYQAAPDAPRWHPSVEVHDVFQGSNRIGRVFLDLHPRPDKYKHAAMFPIVSGVAGQQLPEGALVCNFPDPQVASPALLDHDAVVTFFHELGHLMHHLLGGHGRWVSQSGVATEWDFVEAPSQMLEEWAWDAPTLASFARHMETGAPIPADLVGRMRKADEFGQGTQTRTQTFYAELSRRYHAQDPSALDLHRTLVETQAELSLFPYVPGTHFHTSFGHLNGYSAMYYTYLWSLVIAKDMFSQFKRQGLFDAATAARYRQKVLEPGGAKPAAELVQDFLGRPYDFKAFEEWLNQGAA